MEENWFLESYQKVNGMAASFVKHMEVAVKLAHEDENSMILFSGIFISKLEINSMYSRNYLIFHFFYK